MNKVRLCEDLFDLVGYLLNSAYGLYDEPAGYGPRRLLDAARQLLTAMETAGLSDAYLTQLRRAIDAERFGSSDDQALRAFLDQACPRYAAELKARVIDHAPGHKAEEVLEQVGPT